MLIGADSIEKNDVVFKKGILLQKIEESVKKTNPLLFLSPNSIER